MKQTSYRFLGRNFDADRTKANRDARNIKEHNNLVEKPVDLGEETLWRQKTGRGGGHLSYSEKKIPRNENCNVAAFSVQIGIVSIERGTSWGRTSVFYCGER